MTSAYHEFHRPQRCRSANMRSTGLAVAVLSLTVILNLFGTVGWAEAAEIPDSPPAAAGLETASMLPIVSGTVVAVGLAINDETHTFRLTSASSLCEISFDASVVPDPGKEWEFECRHQGATLTVKRIKLEDDSPAIETSWSTSNDATITWTMASFPLEFILDSGDGSSSGKITFSVGPEGSG